MEQSDPILLLANNEEWSIQIQKFWPLLPSILLVFQIELVVEIQLERFELRVEALKTFLCHFNDSHCG